MDLIPQILIFFQVILIDVSLAGDNAIAIGMAAAGLPAEQRHRAIFRGIALAAVLRILFAVFAVQLLHIIGLLVVGGLLLLWVCWKMYEELRHMKRIHELKAAEKASSGLPHKHISAAILQIAAADVSMSLDNVLAVAGVARDHIVPLAFGLILSVLLMGVSAAVVARIIARFRWVAWIGLLVVLYTAIKMIWEGGQQVWLAAS